MGCASRHLRARRLISWNSIAAPGKMRSFSPSMTFPLLPAMPPREWSRPPGSACSAEDPEAPIEFKLLATENLWRLNAGELFDGAFSNFSGLNCVADLNQTARHLASLLTRGAPVLICLSTRFCLSEMAWFALHGQFRKAFRRCSGFATVKVGDFTVKVNYPTLRAVKKIFSTLLSHAFLHRDRGCGSTFVPGTDVRKYPRLLSCFVRSIGPFPACPGFERLEITCSSTLNGWGGNAANPAGTA